MADDWRAQLPLHFRRRYMNTLMRIIDGLPAGRPRYIENIEEAAYRRATTQREYEYMIGIMISILMNVGARRSSVDLRNRQQQREPLAERIQVPGRESVPQTRAHNLAGDLHGIHLFEDSDQDIMQYIESLLSLQDRKGVMTYETLQSLIRIRERHIHTLCDIYNMCTGLLNQELPKAYRLDLTRAITAINLIVRHLFFTWTTASTEELDTFERYVEWIINRYQ